MRVHTIRCGMRSLGHQHYFACLQPRDACIELLKAIAALNHYKNNTNGETVSVISYHWDKLSR